jgi:cytochrome d ubiquinol oxidase subunit I
VMSASAFLLWRGKLHKSRRMLWILMLSSPFPYIATTAGWWTAELGRQPWMIYGLLRTRDGSSPGVNTGDVVFTALGFAGLYLLLGILFLSRLRQEIAHGPASTS